MKIKEIIQPLLTVKEHELLNRATKIHEHPDFHTDPDQMRAVVRLMKMGLLRQIRDPDKTHYEITEKGEQVLNHN